MKHFFTILCLIVISLLPSSVLGQESKLRVAVFDPTISGQKGDDGHAVIIREMISSTIVNTGKYIIIERSLIDRILKEQKFSNSGVVEESQISALGRLAGANKVILPVLSSAGNRSMLSIKLIDVESASVESQKARMVSEKEILDIIEALTLEVIGWETVDQPVSSRSESTGFAGMKLRIGGKSDKQKQKSAEVEQTSVDVAESPRNVSAVKEQEQITVETVADKKQQFIDRVESDAPMVFPTAEAGKGIVLRFAGKKNRSNPDVSLYINDEFVGRGNLNDGFNIVFNEKAAGKYTLRTEWEGTVPNKSYTLDTRKKQIFEFDYISTGFGYSLELKK